MQLDAAGDELRRVMAATFARGFIEKHAEDFLSQANIEYAKWLADGHKRLPNPNGWLIERARARALTIAARESRRGGPPLEEVIPTVPAEMPTEEVALERDRHRRIAEALAELDEEDRRLLALVYFEEHSIRAAGRLIGWGKSRADRHHGAAMKRLRELLGPRDCIASTIGLVAQATLVADRTRLVGGIRNQVSASIQDLAGLVSRASGGAARGAAPFEALGGAALASGAGRVAATCGGVVAALVCGILFLPNHGIDPFLPGGFSGGLSSRPTPSPASAGAGRETTATSATEAAPPLLRPTLSETKTETHLRRRESRRRRSRLAASGIGQARRAPKRRGARSKASNAKQNSSIEAAPKEPSLPFESEPTPEVEAPQVESEAAPSEESPSPPAATGAQVQEAVGH